MGFPLLRVPRSGQMSSHAGMCQGFVPCWAHSADLHPHLCLPPKPHRGAVKPPTCPAVGMGDSRGNGRDTGWVQQPGTQTCRLGWGHTVHPAKDHPSPLVTANSRWTLCSESLQDAAPCQDLARGEPFCPALPGPTHPDWHREHLSGEGTTLPNASSCRSRAEVQRFVLISLSKPMKQKFPRGKALIFECARMCWKPSQWKIPNQPHITFAKLVKPLTREHLSAAVVPALWSGWKSCGMHRAGAAPLHHPTTGVLRGDSLRGW